MDFCSCGIRKTSLRQRLHSTAKLFSCHYYSRNKCSSQYFRIKKCSCFRFFRGKIRFERIASKASVRTLAKIGVERTGLTCRIASKSGVAPHRKNRAFRLAAETLCFQFWDSPMPLTLYYISQVAIRIIGKTPIGYDRILCSTLLKCSLLCSVHCYPPCKGTQ